MPEPSHSRSEPALSSREAISRSRSSENWREEQSRSNVQDTPPASPQSEQQSRSLQETEPTPFIYAAFMYIICLHQVQPDRYFYTTVSTTYHPGNYPSGPDYLPYRQQSPWRPQYIDIPDRRSCYATIWADPRVAFRGAPSLEHRSGIANFIRNVRRQALSNGRREITVNFRANCCYMIKTEEAIMPNGTVYRLKTNWVKEPSETIEAPPPTELEPFSSKVWDKLKRKYNFCLCAYC